MTPVHLPEVPDEAAGYGTGCNVELAFGEKLYTADQLRAYATEAVMADRVARAVDFLALAAKWRLRADVQELGKSLAIEKCIDSLLELIAETTQPEQNSG